MMIEEFNTNKLIEQVKKIKYMFLTVIVALLASNAYFALMWKREAFREVTYFVTPDATLPAYGKDAKSSKGRNKWEVENFAEELLKSMLEHNKGNFDENINRAISRLDRQSINKFLKIIDGDNLEEMYKENDANAKLTIQRVVVDMSKYPFEVMIEFELEVNFIGREEKIKTKSCVYFHAETVKRSKKNPYGIVATHLYFLTPKEKNKTKNNS